MSFQVFEADMTDENSPLFAVLNSIVNDALVAEGVPFVRWDYDGEPPLNEQHSGYYRIDIAWFREDRTWDTFQVYFSVIDILRKMAEGQWI